MPTPRKHTKPDRDWFTHLPDAALIREAQIVSTNPGTCPLINVGGATWWRWVREGKAPQPVRISRAFTAWRAGDLRKWIAAMPPANRPVAKAHAKQGAVA